MNPINDIAIVLPAFNEEQDLPKLLARIEETLSNQPFRYQVIVVDDGSKDRTADIAREASLRMPVRLIQHPQNRGLGMAMQTGLHAAATSADAVITMDSDNTHDPINVPAMINLIRSGTAQVVIASRYQKGSVIQGVPFHRQILSLGCFVLMKTVVPFKNVSDYSAGFRAYDASILQRMILAYGQDKLVEESGFVCMLEILLKLRAIGATAAAAIAVSVRIGTPAANAAKPAPQAVAGQTRSAAKPGSPLL
jgi:dolichol-phosphate mannosyltransferase